MGSSKHNLGVRGIRSGQWSESKWTNTNTFDPGDTEIGIVYNKFRDKIFGTSDLTVIVLPTHADFIRPINEGSIRKTLEAVPERYLIDLAAVVVLSGSKKQAKTFKNIFAYGRYGSNVIFLHPFPKKFIHTRHKTLPKPSLLNEYERAGATTVRDGDYWWIRFDEKSLREFYLRDVLLHELGHHVDARNFRFKTDRKAESFANWFASEHGYKLRLREDGQE